MIIVTFLMQHDEPVLKQGSDVQPITLSNWKRIATIAVITALLAGNPPTIPDN